MRGYVLAGLMAGWIATALASTTSVPDHPWSQTDAGYLQALRTADLFLAAWARRDPDAGLALMSQAVLKAANEGPADLDREPWQYMSGLSNPHNEAFEISKGVRVGPDRFAFPVTLFVLALGEPSGSACSDTLEVAREGKHWRVDRLPCRF